MIDYRSAPVKAVSAKGKSIFILLVALLLINLLIVQVGRASLTELKISADSVLLARTQKNQTGSGDISDRNDTQNARSLEDRQQKSRWRGEWLMATPFLQGFDPDRLEKAAGQIGEMKGVYSVILVRNGYMVVERYFREGTRTKPHNLKSAAKSVLSALIGIAINEGYMHLDQPIAELLPKIKTFDDPRKRSITVHHLLTMTSGLEPTSYRAYNSWVSNRDWVKAAIGRPLIFEPGTHFQYSTGNSHILSAILSARTGVSTQAYAERKLFSSLGIKVQGWDADPNGIHMGGNNLSLIPRDMAKIGQLYLDGGRFGNRQVVPKWWIDESTRASNLEQHEVYGSYGYSWYVHPGGEDAFVAVGYGGQYIYVSPPHDSVIVVTSTLESKGRAWERKLFERLQVGILGSIGQKDGLLLYAAAKVKSAGASQSKGKTTANVILRSGPSRSSLNIGLVKKGKLVNILETEGKWYRVNYRGKKGWIYGDYIRLSTERAGSSETGLSAAENLRSRSARTKGRLNLRFGPGKSYAVIYTLKPDTSIAIKDQAGLWLHVQAGSNEGWVHKDFVIFEPPAEAPAVAFKTVKSKTDQKITVPKLEQKAVSAEVETTRVKTDLKELQGLAELLRNRFDAYEKGQQQLADKLDLARQGRRYQHEVAARRATERKKIASDLALSRKEIDKLRNIVQDAQSGREKIGAELASARQEMEARRVATVKSEAVVERLVSDLASSRQESGSLRKSLQESRKGSEKLGADVTELRRELESRREATVKSDAGMKNLASDLALSRQEIDKLRNIVQDAQSDREKIGTELASARQEIESLHKRLQESQTGRKELNASVTAIRQEMEARHVATVKSEAVMQSLVAEVTAIRQELKTRREIAIKSVALRKNLRADLSLSNQEAEKLRRIVQDAQAGREQLEVELTSAWQQIESLQKDLQKSSADRKKLHADVAAIRQEQEAQRQGAAKSEAMGQNLASARQQIERMHKDLQATRTDRKKLSLDVTALRQEFETQREAAAKVETDRKNLVSDLASAHQRIVSLQKTLQESKAGRKKLAMDVSALRWEMESQQQLAADKSAADRKSLVSVLSSVRKQIGKLNSELQSSRKSHKDLVAQVAKIHRQPDARLKADASLKPVLEHPAVKRESTPMRVNTATVPGKTKTTGKELYELSDITPVSKNSARYPSNEPPIFQHETASIDGLLQSWADAWSRKDVAGYLSHYAPIFRPSSGADFKKWSRQRKKRVGMPDFIEIKVDNVKTERKGANRARVTFRQLYRSNLYADRVVKTLDLIWKGDGWKIIQETSRPVK